MKSNYFFFFSITTLSHTKPTRAQLPTAEQIRIAQITEIKSGAQDPTREKVTQLMEMTERSEEDACLALYECDNDLEQAVVYLLENLEVGALITTTKKKKNKAAATDGAGDGDDGEQPSNQRDGARDGHDRSRGSRGSNRGGRPDHALRGRSRPGGGDSRDERQGGGGQGDRPGRGVGPRRGGFATGARGGRGGRMGPRGTNFRETNHRANNYNRNNQDQAEIDNWDPASTTQAPSGDGKEETWGDCGDWDNEEYTGSLTDTKVFTPSGATAGPNTAPSDLNAPPGLEQTILNPPSQDVQYSTAVASSTAPSGAINNGVGQYPEMTTAAAQLRQSMDIPSATLSAEQSQYFTSLSSQNNTAYGQANVQYSYGGDQVANSQAPRQQQQQRARARVPPPSKIPQTAVEMPGDALSNVYLDVQFGGLDFGSGEDAGGGQYETEKYNNSGLDQSAGDDYSAKGTGGVAKGSQSAGLGGLQQSQLIQNSDSISSSGQADLSAGYAQRNSSGQSALDQLAKQGDIYAAGNQTTGAGNNYQNLSYSATQKNNAGYQTGTGYGGNAYNSAQSTTYPPSSNYGYNQSSYNQQSQGTQSGQAGQQTQTGASGTAANATNQSVPVNNNNATR